MINMILVPNVIIHYYIVDIVTTYEGINTVSYTHLTLPTTPYV